MNFTIYYLFSSNHREIIVIIRYTAIAIEFWLKDCIVPIELIFWCGEKNFFYRWVIVQLCIYQFIWIKRQLNEPD